MRSAWAVALLMVVACGREKDSREIAGELRLATATAIEMGTLSDAEAAFARLEEFGRRHSLSPNGDIAKMLARRYQEQWDLSRMKTRSARVFEVFQQANSCSRVASTLSWRDPEALRDLTDVLRRGRELLRRSCDYWGAADASAWLGDIAGIEADLAAAHAPDCEPELRSVGPSTWREQHAIGVAFGRGDLAAARRAAEAVLARGLGRPNSEIDSCRARVTLAYLTETQQRFGDARRLYAEVGAVQDQYGQWKGPPGAGDDLCFPTAAARLLALDGAVDAQPLPTVQVRGIVHAPPGTTVRVAFQAHPPIAPGGYPDVYGMGLDANLRHPWPDRSVFWVDAAIDGGNLSAELPPGWWLPQIELEPPGEWELDEASCLGSIEIGSSPIQLPALAFEGPD